MSQTPQEVPELPPSLRLLKRLVTVLTAVMILAVITITGLLVTRLPNLAAPPALPPALALPKGTKAQAVTMGTGWIAVVTQDDRLLIFGTDGQLRQEIRIDAK
jgi:Family of unknown function (DUF6476)